MKAMDRARLSRLLYPNHSPFETAVWISAWTCGVGYSIYNSFRASQGNLTLNIRLGWKWVTVLAAQRCCTLRFKVYYYWVFLVTVTSGGLTTSLAALTFNRITDKKSSSVLIYQITGLDIYTFSLFVCQFKDSFNIQGPTYIFP